MKKGFTLIELLAVIVILGILSVLIVPKIVNTLKDSEEKTNMASAEGLLKAAEYRYQNDSINRLAENTIINYEMGQNIDKLDYNGSKPEKGEVKITTEGHIAIAVKIGDNCYIKSFSGNDITKQAYNDETCKLMPSFENDSWIDIKSNLLFDRNTYEVGDTKEVEIDGESYTVRIANISSCPQDWPIEASRTTCGVVIEFIDTIKDSTNNNTDGHIMNPTSNSTSVAGDGNVGGWPASSMRSYINTTLFDKLPDELKKDDMILDTKVISSHGTEERTNFISTDKLYLLSFTEVIGTNTSLDTVNLVSDTVRDGTRQLEYYGTSGSTRIKNTTEGTAKSWWLRSAVNGNRGWWNVMYNSGIPLTDPAYVENGVAPAFRILD